MSVRKERQEYSRNNCLGFSKAEKLIRLFDSRTATKFTDAKGDDPKSLSNNSMHSSSCSAATGYSSETD